MDITLICNREATETPKFISYDGVRLVVEWTTPVGCYSSGEDKPAGDKPVDDGKEQVPHENVGSGIGWFFLMYVLRIVTQPRSYLDVHKGSSLHFLATLHWAPITIILRMVPEVLTSYRK
jgi:hypothetical protein